MTVAIDGPAGTGKSTIASLIAKEFNYVFLNSGSFYRAVTLACLEKKLIEAGEAAESIRSKADEILSFAKTLSLEYDAKTSHFILNGKDVESMLHSDSVDSCVSAVSSIVPVRHLVNEKMRLLTSRMDIVCEGRDMTTVVFPKAELKIYLDASIDVQAQRRFNQGCSGLTLEEVKQAIIERDRQDRNKAEGALKKADDAVYIDTSDLTIEQVCEIIKRKIQILSRLPMAKTEVEMESLDNNENIQTQLQEYLEGLETREEGQLVDGTVIQVTPDQVFVDVGCKSEGKIPASEFTELPKVGDVVQVVLISKESKHGEVIVSKQKADVKSLWKKLRQAAQDKIPVEGTIDKIVKGGFEVELGSGTKAFLPISQSDSQKVDKPEKLLGTKSKFYIERLYSDNKANVVVNRRKYLEESIETNRDAFFNSIQIGQTVKGTVKSFTSFGAFIDLGGFDGLLHINDMSWGHVTRPKDFVKKGQEIELKVIRLDPAEKRINLSLKHFTEDPWLHFEDKYHVNDIVKGKVTKLTEFGAFIELEEGIEGLAHISEFSWVKKISKPGDMVQIGQEVECMVLGYDIQAGRVSLGLKQVTENPWDSIAEKYPVGTKLTRKVVKLANAGAFIELEEGIDGFLHADDISWTKKVKHPGSELEVGKEYEVIVIENEPEQHKIRLGIKQLTEDPWVKFVADHPVGSTFEGEVVSITDFGVFVRADGGIEGLVNKANLSENRDEPYEETIKKYKVGDKINVYVVDVNPSKQKAAFSVKEFKKKQQRDEISQYMSQNGSDDDGAYTLGDMLKNKNN